MLQAFYQVQEEEAARKKKEEYLEKYYATVKVLDKQVAEARAAKKKQEEDDLAAVRAELARTESMARAQKEAEDKRRQARVLEFKEREIERARVMKEKQRRKEEEMRREQEEVWAQAPAHRTAASSQTALRRVGVRAVVSVCGVHRDGIAAGGHHQTVQASRGRKETPQNGGTQSLASGAWGRQHAMSPAPPF